MVGRRGLARSVGVEEGVAEQPMELRVVWREPEPTMARACGPSRIAKREADIRERLPDPRQLADRRGRRRRVPQEGDEDSLRLARGVALPQELGEEACGLEVARVVCEGRAEGMESAVNVPRLEGSERIIEGRVG